MATARTLANIKKHHYRVLHRTPAALTSPADPESSAADFATWLASFTELGYARDKTIKAPIVQGDIETLDDTNKKTMGYNLNLEATLLQSDPSDDDEYDALEGTSADLFFYSESTGKCRFYPAVILNFEEQAAGGETEATVLKCIKENASNKAAIRTIFDEPLV